MRKVVIVVEGVTEIVFVHGLLDVLLGVNTQHAIRWQFQVSGNWNERVFGNVNGDVLDILLISPGGDGSVRSWIRERIKGFADAGFSAVIGLRDLYNRQQPVDLEWNRKDDENLTATWKIKTTVYFAVQEIEAWFLLDYQMPSRFNAGLTVEKIEDKFGINLRAARVETISHPALVLARILKSVGVDYDKSEGSVQRVCFRLDYENLYVTERKRCPSIDSFLLGLDDAITFRIP